MKNKRRVLIPGIAVLLLLLVVSSAYSYYSAPVSKNFTSRSLVVNVPCLNITVTEANAINLTKQVPVTDTYGKSLTPSTVTITNNCSDNQVYTLTLNSISNSSSNYANNYLQDNTIKVNVKKGSTVVKNSVMLSTLTAISSSNTNYTQMAAMLAASYTNPTYTLQSSRILDSGTLSANSSATYAINIWIDYNEGCASGNTSCNNTTQNKIYNGIFYVLGTTI